MNLASHRMISSSAYNVPGIKGYASSRTTMLRTSRASFSSRISPIPQNHPQPRSSSVSLPPAPSPTTAHHRQIRCAASSESSSNTETLPIFPLGLVALPSASVPLHIFEARYRVLFSTLLAGSEGANEDLIDDSKAWKGSRTFGMCWINGDGQMASTGTSLYIDAMTTLPDGRMLIENTGQRRFTVKKIVQERPYLVCDVEWLDEVGRAGGAAVEDDEDSPFADLAAKVLQLFKDVLGLNFKLRGVNIDEIDARIDFEEKAKLSPSGISFWVASMFSDAEETQQMLLEMKDTETRLRHEENVLSEALKFLSAQAALKSVFSSDSGEGSTTK